MRLALLGYPVAHSLSPAMHNAALAHVGLDDWRYEALAVAPGRLAEAVAAIRSDEYAGGNVTVPHKETIIPLLDGLTPVAEAIGAVNLLLKRDGRLLGHNTDSAGFLADLHTHAASIAHRPVLILGAGGAARSAAAACAGVGSQVRLLARRREAALRLVARHPTAQVFDWTALGFLQACDDCALIVNTTPLGMTPNIEASPWMEGTPFPPSAFVYDMVYNPPETRFIRQARAEGLRADTGLGMLVEQGALGFELWTGRTAPRGLMRAAAEERLRAAQPVSPG